MMKFLLEQRQEAADARTRYERIAAKLLTAGVVVEITRGSNTYEATVSPRGEGSMACVSGDRVYVVSDAGRGYWVGLSRIRDFHAP